MAADTHKQIKIRTYLAYLGVCCIAMGIVYKMVQVQFVQGADWRKKAEENTIKLVDVPAMRGNLYDCNGQLLATSIPVYDISVDVTVIDKELWKDSVEALAKGLAKILGEKTGNQYYSLLQRARADERRYKLLKTDVSHEDYLRLRKLPIFNQGQNKGGLMVDKKYKRHNTYNNLGLVIIGKEQYKYDKANPTQVVDTVYIGLEGAYDSLLNGIAGKRLMQKMAGNVYKPLYDDNDIQPQGGRDVVTTLDINLQDVATTALNAQLLENNAEYGCAVLMEVATGDIKAMVNLTKGKNGYYEGVNYALKDADEPGSVFKLMALTAALDDGYTDLNNTTNLSASAIFCPNDANGDITDAHPRGGPHTVTEIFAYSSNVGVSKIVNNAYGANPKKYFAKLRSMGLVDTVSLAIKGMQGITYTEPGAAGFSSCISLPSQSIGYGLKISPLQTLMFYNAIANNGKMVRPRFATAVRYQNTLVNTIGVSYVNQQICKPATAAKARTMLEAVTEYGTAKNAFTDVKFKVAGKTGTARAGYSKANNSAEKAPMYRATFCGYFPADKPKYSLIVVVKVPSGGEYMGGKLAAPVFKAISEKVYAFDLDLHKKDTALTNNTPTAFSFRGNAADIETATERMGLLANANYKADWVNTTITGKRATLVANDVKPGSMPNVVGMTLKDALFILENMGLRVVTTGRGKVTTQTPEAGVGYQKNATVTLQLQ